MNTKDPVDLEALSEDEQTAYFVALAWECPDDEEDPTALEEAYKWLRETEELEKCFPLSSSRS